MYVYILSENVIAPLYTVGFYDPSGEWHPECDYADKEKAAARVHWLNGGNKQIEKEGDKADGKIKA